MRLHKIKGAACIGLFIISSWAWGAEPAKPAVESVKPNLVDSKVKQDEGAPSDDKEKPNTKVDNNLIAIEQYCSGTPAADIARRYKAYAKEVRSRIIVRIYKVDGELCDVSDEFRISEGDVVIAGYVVSVGSAPPGRIVKTLCEQESADPRVRDELSKIVKQSTDREKSSVNFVYAGMMDCYGPEVKYQVSSGNGFKEESYSQYTKYRGTWQLGAVWVEEKDKEYNLVDYGSGNVIHADKDDSRGPEYVASLTVYGVPHYLRTLTCSSGCRYSGRDIVNQNSFLDRVGLNFSIGLTNPSETFGVGLSFELVPGINVTYSRLYRELEVLSGVSEGDSWASGSIPTKDSWESENVWGISIDGNYIAKFLGFSEQK